KYSSRFILFLNINFEELDDEGWPDNTLQLMEEARKLGING
ncbi:MAG TPA: amidohydrolase, partial [Cytophagales bacterium]|nr:amidohydrolase [Cytophagales bacterium]